MDRVPGWIDRDERQEAEFPGIVILANGNRLPVTITNVSEGGCQLECGHPLPIGESVKLELAGGHGAEGNVRWSVSGKAGLRFDRLY